ncbi:MAG TPA: hypothetical protein VFV23_01190 [Verrucomicrobiae bacterium]|nr:hypothetical protein [Verrucomicrobiae bacterium]
MLMRIFLIVAIVAGLAAGVLNFTVVKNKITALTEDRNTQRTQKQQAQTELASTKKDLKKTRDDLAQTQQQLTDTQAERDKALASADAQKKRADDLSTKLAQTTQERDTARNELEAYTVTGTAQQFASMNKTLQKANEQIDALNGENKLLQHQLQRKTDELARLIGTNNIVITLPPELHGKVMVVDPKWDFVVVNIGDDQGVKEDGELLVSRDGKLVAKVVVRTVQKDRSIANVVPGWKLGDIYEGDVVTPAHPAS